MTLALTAAQAHAGGELRIEPGTVLEMSVVGIPELRYKVVVDASGDASFPLLEPMQVEGLSLSDVRARLRQELPRKVFRQRGANGRENYVTIAADEITLEIAQYRPIYISGDIAKPGELEFRPGLTVRQAVALAGGYDLVRSRSGNPLVESAEFRGEYEEVMTKFAKQQGRLAAIQAALDGKSDTDIRGQLTAALPSAVLDRIAELEKAAFKVSNESYKRELESLRASADQAATQLSVLAQERKRLSDVLPQQAKDLERLRSLYERHVVPITRMTDEQRQYEYASDRMSQLSAQIMQTALTHEELKRKLQAAIDQHQIQLLTEMQESNVKLQEFRTRLATLSEKLIYTGALKAQVMRGLGSTPDIVIYRRAEGRLKRQAAAEDDSLEAGDVVEISFKLTEVLPMTQVGIP